MRVNYDYKSKEDWEQEKAEFMSLYYYFDDEEWFDKEAVDKIKLQMIEKGFKGAFVVAFYKGRKISTKKALDLQLKNKSHE